MKEYPGAQCLQQLLRLKELMGNGSYTPPIAGIIRGKESFSFVLSGPDDIVVEGSENGHSLVSVRQGDVKFLVSAKEAYELRVGKDDAGKAIFLSLQNS